MHANHHFSAIMELFFLNLQSGPGYSIANTPQPLPNSIPVPTGKPQISPKETASAQGNEIKPFASNVNFPSGMFLNFHSIFDF